METDLFNPPVVNLARAHAEELSMEFLEWLPQNLAIWDAFCTQAMQIFTKGIKHYSSYTIVEFLRHHTALADSAGEFKINNNIRPYLSRLFDIAYPQCAGLFEYRQTTKPKGDHL